MGLPKRDLAKLKLSFVPDMALAVKDADVIQENGPENKEFKQQVGLRWSATVSPTR
jgi:3-hydroxyacyl-CoA dehydrogenase